MFEIKIIVCVFEIKIIVCVYQSSNPYAGVHEESSLFTYFLLWRGI
jgi:hypothetical protein